MRAIDIITALALAGCSVQGQDTALENDFPIETVKCTHPDSNYEAVVEVSVKDSHDWEDIHFEINQAKEVWDTLLWEPGDEDPTWHTRMQIMEFNCRVTYEYDFFYVGSN